ncbi:TPA: hypothetical protein HA265_08305, partial [Candidatus Woesearchaeota archaeon]|nr:hypothetical protein [Candidatus Woesearchaeota archaeon]
MDDGVYEVVEPKKRDLVLRMYDWGRDSVQGIGEFAKGLVVGSIVPYMIPTAIRVGNQPLYTDPDTNEVPGIIIGTVGSFFLTGAL